MSCMWIKRAYVQTQATTVAYVCLMSDIPIHLNLIWNKRLCLVCLLFTRSQVSNSSRHRRYVSTDVTDDVIAIYSVNMDILASIVDFEEDVLTKALPHLFTLTISNTNIDKEFTQAAMTDSLSELGKSNNYSYGHLSSQCLHSVYDHHHTCIKCA